MSVCFNVHDNISLTSFGKGNSNYSPTTIGLVNKFKIALSYSNSWKPYQIYRFSISEKDLFYLHTSLGLFPPSDITLSSNSFLELAGDLLKDHLQQVSLAWRIFP